MSQASFAIRLGVRLPTTFEASVEQASKISSEPQRASRPHSVLVVDDNEEVGQFSAELLGDLGYVVRRASSTDFALTSARNGAIEPP